MSQFSHHGSAFRNWQNFFSHILFHLLTLDVFLLINLLSPLWLLNFFLAFKIPFWSKGRLFSSDIYFSMIETYLPHFYSLWALWSQVLILTDNVSPVSASQCVRSPIFQLEFSVSEKSMGSDSNSNQSRPLGQWPGQTAVWSREAVASCPASSG